MSRYRKVDPRIWNDKKFAQLGNYGKLLFLFLLTHPGMTALGAMRATPAGLAEELGWELKAFMKAFDEVLSRDMAEHDQKACLMALPNFIRYNQPESPNVIRAWVGALDLLPECDMKEAVVQRAKSIVGEMTDGFVEAFAEAFEQASPNPKQKQKPKQKKEGAAARTPSAAAAAPPPKGKKSKSPKTDIPEDFQVSERVTSWATTNGYENLQQHLEAFKRKVAANGYQRVSWDDAFMEAIREDWAKLRGRTVTGAAPGPDHVAGHWSETPKGVNAKAAELGLEEWSEAVWMRTGEQYPSFRARVIEAAGEEVPA